MSARRWMLLVLAAMVCGVLATRPLVAFVAERLAVQDGPWRTSLATGSAAANPYERAAVAIAGLYALAPHAAVYYTAFTDADGRTLDASCRYAVSGVDPPARWWSLTLYGADHYLVDNAAHRYSVRGDAVVRDASGGFSVQVAASPQPGDWLPSPRDGAFSLTLRLYGPAPAVLTAPAAVPLPSLQRLDCA